MIKFISYIIISIFGISISFAQVTSEEIMINNAAIQLSRTLTYTQEKAPLIIWVHGSPNFPISEKLIKIIVQFVKK